MQKKIGFIVPSDEELAAYYASEPSSPVASDPAERAAFFAEEEEAVEHPLFATQSIRRDLLNRAADLVDGDRNAQYGDPIDDFRRTGIYWSTHAGGVLRRKLSNILFDLDEFTQNIILDYVDHLFDPHDVAIMMTQLKNSRLAWSPEKQDHWDDSAGYSACGWDCVVRTTR